ncbi:hypothetical protein EMPS_10734 [Entomortierella parvispora]|uniref:Uncharacterized protein n=1 Tax=Entomortierella parvispora TaxID=205924 RepID=A0A9P3HKF3_9FUNG|nr:hypothetical protein EMPS_10734 [Entomortierella parvispora]
MVILDNVHDSRVANVSMQCDDLGVDLEDFYGMFGSLPSFLGQTVEILNSVASFLSRIVAPGESCLKRLIVDPKILTENAQQCILEVINRCMLSELTVRYPDECLDFLVKAASCLNQTELIIHCKVNEFIQVYQRLVGSTFVNADIRRLKLVDNACTIVFEDILNPIFKTIHINNNTPDVVEFSWGVFEILPSDIGYTHRITCAIAEKLNRWSDSFTPHHTDFRVDTTILGDSGIRDMVAVISKSKLTTLRVYCSDGQPVERARRNGFLEEVMPCLGGAYLYVECRVHEFAEMRMFIQGNTPEAYGVLSWYLCDGDRYLASPGCNIPPILDLRGKRGVYYVGEHGVLEDNWDELGNTILSGFEGLQEVIHRSPGLREFAFVCGCDFAYTMSEAALEMLVRNRKIVTELVVTGSEIRSWLRRLACHMPTRAYLPLLTKLKIRSDSNPIDTHETDWVTSIVRHVDSLRELETIHLKNWTMDDVYWERFLGRLAPKVLAELDLSGSNVPKATILEWAAQTSLKKLNLQETSVDPSAMQYLQDAFGSDVMDVKIELSNMHLTTEPNGQKTELFDDWEGYKAEWNFEEDYGIDFGGPFSAPTEHLPAASWVLPPPPKQANDALARPVFYNSSPSIHPRSPQVISAYTSISASDPYASFSQSPTTPTIDQFNLSGPSPPTSAFSSNCGSGERRAPQMLYPTAMCLQEQIASEGSLLSGATAGEDRIRSPHDSYPPPNSPQFWSRLSETLMDHLPKSVAL